MCCSSAYPTGWMSEVWQMPELGSECDWICNMVVNTFSCQTDPFPFPSLICSLALCSWCGLSWLLFQLGHSLEKCCQLCHWFLREELVCKHINLAGMKHCRERCFCLCRGFLYYWVLCGQKGRSFSPSTFDLMSHITVVCLAFPS